MSRKKKVSEESLCAQCRKEVASIMWTVDRVCLNCFRKNLGKPAGDNYEKA